MKKQTKIILAATAAVLLIAAMLVAYITLRPQPEVGTKTVTLEVVDKEGKTTTYSLTTDAEYLIDVMKDAQKQGFSFEGEEGQYGFSPHTINGLKADYNTDNAYWAFYINGEYCNLGVSEQPVADGDVFTIRYSIFK